MSQRSSLITIAQRLREDLSGLRFGPPVYHVYNPLTYAWAAHRKYLARFGKGRHPVLIVGMNPGYFGMVQTGVPFGEINAVRDWMKIEERIGRPHREHPRRRVEGFGCERSEVSGKRLWGLFAERFGVADNFFADHFVINYCPLAFFDMEGRNLTPDKLPASQSASLLEACDQHLRRVGEILQPEWLIGVGDFAEKRARQVFAGAPVRIGKILHPSPASPAANKNWAKRATEQLKSLGTWT